jgi:hypothetical protein
VDRVLRALGYNVHEALGRGQELRDVALRDRSAEERLENSEQPFGMVRVVDAPSELLEGRRIGQDDAQQGQRLTSDVFF